MKESGTLVLVKNVLFFLLWGVSLAAETFTLREGLAKAQVGDYIVTAQGKNLTLLHISQLQGTLLTLEEITAPSSRVPQPQQWKEWIQQNAPGNTSWVVYTLDLRDGQMASVFSYTRNSRFQIPDADNFLSHLLNLQLEKVPEERMRRVGRSQNYGGANWRDIWQPLLVFEGTPLPGVLFYQWSARWRKDGSDLSGKWIDLYLPAQEGPYPSYFPYWLQISGMIGKAKIRIIDSGTHMVSPKTKFSPPSAVQDTKSAPVLDPQIP